MLIAFALFISIEELPGPFNTPRPIGRLRIVGQLFQDLAVQSLSLVELAVYPRLFRLRLEDGDRCR